MAAADTGWRIAAVALAWLGGVALHLQERLLWPAAVYAAGALLAALVLVAAWRRRDRRTGDIGALPPRLGRGPFVAALCGAGLLGAALSGLHASWRLADRLDGVLEGRDLRVTGTVASLPQPTSTGLRFRLRIDEAWLDGRPVRAPRHVALGWYAGLDAAEAADAAPPRLRAGERWRMTVRLRQPHGNINPHGYDYELYLFEQGVRATGYVRAAPAERLSEADGYRVERLRHRVRDAIEAAVPDKRSAGVLAALAVGDQGAIARDDWELFRNTGIAHLVSISGLHVTMFAWLAGGVVALLWRRSARAMLWLATPLAARWGGLLASTGYAVLAGWGVPAQRTVLMLACVTALRAGGLRWPWVLVLLCAAVAVTAIDPWALLQAGFWLSFVAVGLLMAAEPPGASAAAPDAPAGAPWWQNAARAIERAGIAGARMVRTQAWVTLGLAPLSVVFFQQVSAVGLLANLFAIPLVTLLITPLSLLGALYAPLWSLGAALVQGLAAVLEGLAAWPGAVWTVPAAPPWARVLGLGAAVLLALRLPWRARLMAVPLLLPLLWPAGPLPPEGEFELVAADVGQGTAVLVRTRNHLLLYDAGPQYSRDSDAGQRVLLPLLRARGERRVDALVLSHRDSDHVGGAAALMSALPVVQLLHSLEPAHVLLAAGAAPARRCEDGLRWHWDGVRFEVLGPPAEDHARGLKPNALSCVLKVSARGASVLLTGDIERDQEAALLERHGERLRGDVLLVPHHGSRTSSSQTFLAVVAPRTAVVQAGYRNRFGHPAADVVARLRAAGVHVVRSDECGAWRWQSHASPEGRCERVQARRYWRREAAPRAG